MPFVVGLDLIIVSIVVYLFLTQLLLPVIRGTKIFPMFRKEGKLRSQVTDVNQKILEKGLEENLTKTKKKEGLE